MRAVVQRVRGASVEVAGATVGCIDEGLLVLLGVARGDGDPEAAWMVDKLSHLRIFPDAAGRFDASLLDIHGAALVVSQFTLCAQTDRGRRPSFADAAAPPHAEPLYQRVVDGLRARGITTATGAFGAQMLVHLTNDGPVTLVLDAPPR